MDENKLKNSWDVNVFLVNFSKVTREECYVNKARRFRGTLE